MAIITRTDVLECDQCGHEWLPERGKGRLPKQCPSRKCRSAKWNLKGKQEPVFTHKELPHETMIRDMVERPRKTEPAGPAKELKPDLVINRSESQE